MNTRVCKMQAAFTRFIIYTSSGSIHYGRIDLAKTARKQSPEAGCRLPSKPMADMLCCDITNIFYLFCVFIFYYKKYQNFKQKYFETPFSVISDTEQSPIAFGCKTCTKNRLKSCYTCDIIYSQRVADMRNSGCVSLALVFFRQLKN